MKTKNTHPLPYKLSELILVALEDLEKAEKDPRYEINMADWHNPNGVCSVCFAGAVMAFELGLKPDMDRVPSSFPDSIGEPLRKLDRVREGRVCEVGLDVSFDTTDYHDSPELFKLEMVLTAAALSQLGL